MLTLPSFVKVTVYSVLDWVTSRMELGVERRYLLALVQQFILQSRVVAKQMAKRRLDREWLGPRWRGVGDHDMDGRADCRDRRRVKPKPFVGPVGARPAIQTVDRDRPADE